jgi:hypothetical protein
LDLLAGNHGRRTRREGGREGGRERETDALVHGGIGVVARVCREGGSGCGWIRIREGESPGPCGEGGML